MIWHRLVLHLILSWLTVSHRVKSHHIYIYIYIHNITSTSSYRIMSYHTPIIQYNTHITILLSSIIFFSSLLKSTCFFCSCRIWQRTGTGSLVLAWKPRGTCLAACSAGPKMVGRLAKGYIWTVLDGAKPFLLHYRCPIPKGRLQSWTCARNILGQHGIGMILGLGHFKT